MQEQRAQQQHGSAVARYRELSRKLINEGQLALFSHAADRNGNVNARVRTTSHETAIHHQKQLLQCFTFRSYWRKTSSWLLKDSRW